MKKFLKNFFYMITVGFICLSSMNISAAPLGGEAGYLRNYRAILQEMKTAMGDVPRVGEPEIDYLQQMILHHSGGMRLAENAISYSSSESVKQMARRMIDHQRQEAAELGRMMRSLRNVMPMNKAQEAAYMNDFLQFLDAMMSAMEDARPTGSVDKDFLQAMIAHHDGGINMSRTILRYTNNNAIKQTAQSIMRRQDGERQEMVSLIRQMNR